VQPLKDEAGRMPQVQGVAAMAALQLAAWTSTAAKALRLPTQRCASGRAAARVTRAASGGRVNPDHTTTLIANLSAFLRAHPVAHPEADDFEPDGTWYSMVRTGTTLYAVEANHGELDKITLNGHISRVADISFFMGHIVPTSVAVGPDGNLYIGNLSTLPYLDGKAVILKVTPQGRISIAVAARA
jgi:hypothetical protein